MGAPAGFIRVDVFTGSGVQEQTIAVGDIVRYWPDNGKSKAAIQIKGSIHTLYVLQQVATIDAKIMESRRG